MPGVDDGLEGQELRVRVTSVVVDPDGDAAILALAPPGLCSTPLVSRPSMPWATIVVYVSARGKEASAKRLTDESALFLDCIGEGIRFRGGRVDQWFLVAALPDNAID